MSKTPLYLGIDFGTTNSSVAYVYGDPRHLTAQYVPVEPVRIAMDSENTLMAERMPSLISTRFDDRRAKGLVQGWEVLRIFGRRKKSPLLRRGHEIFESVKSDLGSQKLYAHSSSPDCRTPKQVATAIFAALLREAEQKLPGLVRSAARTVITVPASLNAEARQETREAACAAGLAENLIELIDEPIAALLHLINDQRATAVLSMGEPRNILVFDYGGGTLDLCLVKASFDPSSKSGLRAENLAISQYRRNGGNDVDAEVMRLVLWPQVESQIDTERDELPADLRRAIEDTLTSTLARKLKEKLCVKIGKVLEAGEGLSGLRPDLSETVTTEGDFVDDRLEKPIRGRFKMTKEQFDQVMATFLALPESPEDIGSPDWAHSLILPIWGCLEKARLSPEDLDVLVLHGGSCRNPYVRDQLKTLLSSETSPFAKTMIVETPNLDTSVACGAALACYWKHERSVELIKPVTAEDIGILTLGNRPACLVPSGTPLPFPPEGVHSHPTDFYVPQNGQKELIIPFCAGASERNHRLCGSVKVPLPEGTRRGDVVKLKLTVDPNKILHWWYSVGHSEFTAATPISDPWSPRQLEPAEKRLLSFRRQMLQEYETSGTLPDGLLIREAGLLREAEQLEEAEISLRDFAAERSLTASVANLLALVCGQRGETRDERYYAEKASLLDPENPILLGNYACVLAEGGMADQAVAKMRLALQHNPDLDYLYERLGNIYREQGKEEEALREFRQAIRILEKRVYSDPDPCRRWGDLARLYHKTGDYEHATEASTRSSDAHLNEVFDGDHRHRIAGPDSGF